MHPGGGAPGGGIFPVTPVPTPRSGVVAGVAMTFTALGFSVAALEGNGEASVNATKARRRVACFMAAVQGMLILMIKNRTDMAGK